jgi:hypothetical protein
MVVLSRRAVLPAGESTTGSAYQPPNSPATFRLLELAYPCIGGLSRDAGLLAHTCLGRSSSWLLA